MLYDSGMNTKNSRTVRLIRASIHIILCVMFAFGIRTALQTFLHRSQYTSSVTNTLCSSTDTRERMIPLMKQKNNRTDVHQVFRDPLTSVFSKDEQQKLKEEANICAAPEPLQFKKFLWFLTDGLPVKYSMKSINHYKDHAVLYTIDIPGPKYSHAIYTSYMTGQLPTNYQGKSIEGDSILKAMQRSPDIGPLTYIGPEWSFLAIQGKNNYNQLFKRILNKPEPLDQPHDKGYRFFFKDEPSKTWFKKILDYLSNEKGSLLTHSAIFDHVNHGVYRNNPGEAGMKRLDQVAGRIADDLNTVKQWIDAHPDYLLILSSDHGCDDVSNGYVLHGYSANGNEGYVMLYNPKLTPHRQRVDVVDIAPTIAKYLSKVDIPSDNIGVARTYFGNDVTSVEFQNNLLKQNILQMVDTSKRRGISIAKDTIANLLKMTSAEAAVKSAYEFNKELMQVATSLKMNLYKLIQRPYHWVAYYGVQSFIVILLILYRYNYNLFSLASKSHILNMFSGSLLLVPMYFGVFINILFVWDSWKNIIRGGGPFFIWHGYLGLIIFYLLVRTTSATTDERKREDILEIGKRFLCLSLADMTWFALYTLLKQQWKNAVGSNYFFYVPYLGLVAFILVTSNVSITNVLLFPFRLIKRIVLRNRQIDQRETAGNPDVKKDYIHLIISLIMLAVLLMFEMTSVKETASREEKAKYISYYNMFGFHRYYAAFLPMIAVYFIVTVIFNTKNLHRLMVPASLYAFAIMRDTPHSRVVLLVTNFQYYLLLVPIIQKVNSLVSEFRKNHPPSTSTKNSAQTALTAHSWDLLQQALTLYLVNEPMFQFVVGKEEKLNVDAHPFAGAIGMRSHQEYPSFNAFQMAFEKWHPMLLFALFMWVIVHKIPKIDYATKKRLTAPEKATLKSSAVDIILSVCSLLLLNANMFLQLLLCFISMGHPFEDCIVYLIVMSVNGLAFTLFHTLTEYFNICNIFRLCVTKRNKGTPFVAAKDKSDFVLPMIDTSNHKVE